MPFRLTKLPKFSKPKRKKMIPYYQQNTKKNRCEEFDTNAEYKTVEPQCIAALRFCYLKIKL